MKPRVCLLAAALLLAPTLHAANFTVTNTNDAGAGSLRQALADAIALAGADTITFDASLSGQSIALTGVPNASVGASALTVSGTGAITVDATSLPGGLTLVPSAAGHRAFLVSTGSSLNLLGLTLTGFAAESESTGGAIRSSGAVTLTRCIFSGNSAPFSGGAIDNRFGTLGLTRCTLSGNSSGSNGGAINGSGNITMTQCTLSGNSASDRGGAIATIGSSSLNLTLTHCTLSSNSAVTSSGAIFNVGFTMTLNNTIATGNTANASPINVNPPFSGAGNLTDGDPALASLGNYGGPTQTMALLPSSPARNTSVGSAITSDQRGFPVVGTPDIGAYEAGSATDFNAWIYESLPATATAPQHAATFDFDGDGQSNHNEWLARSDPANGASYHHVTQTALSGTNLNVTFPSVLGRSYRLQSSPNLANPWTDLGIPMAGTGSDITLPTNISGFPLYFFRVSVGDP